MHPRVNKRSKFGSVYAVIKTERIRSFYAQQTSSRENSKTWSVQQKKELLESSAYSESEEDSLASRNVSPASQRIMDNE